MAIYLPISYANARGKLYDVLPFFSLTPIFNKENLKPISGLYFFTNTSYDLAFVFIFALTSIGIILLSFSIKKSNSALLSDLQKYVLYP